MLRRDDAAAAGDVDAAEGAGADNDKRSNNPYDTDDEAPEGNMRPQHTEAPDADAGEDEAQEEEEAQEEVAAAYGAGAQDEDADENEENVAGAEEGDGEEDGYAAKAGGDNGEAADGDQARNAHAEDLADVHNEVADAKDAAPEDDDEPEEEVPEHLQGKEQGCLSLPAVSRKRFRGSWGRKRIQRGTWMERGW